MRRIIQLFIWIGQFFQKIILVTRYRLTLWYIWPIWEKNCPAINHSLCTKIRIFLRDTSLALRAGLHCIYKAALALCAFLRKPQSSTKLLERQRKNATIYTHRTGENIRAASRSSNSRWTPRTHKTPGKTSASKLSEDLPYGQSGIRRLTPSSLL